MFAVKGVSDGCKPRRYFSEPERRRRASASAAFYSEDTGFKPRPGDSLNVSQWTPRSQPFHTIPNSLFVSHPTFPCHVVKRFFRGFAQSLETNGWILIGLDHGDFLCNPFKFALLTSSLNKS